MSNKDNEKKKIRVGVAGAGKMGQNHIRVLSELNSVFNLIGFYDPDQRKADIAKKYGVRYFNNYEEMLREVDAVTLPCPTSLHKDMALKAASWRKHALVEKPMAETLDDAKEIASAFSKGGLKLTVGYVERFNPVVKALADIVQDMEIVAVEAHRCSPFDSRIYDVDVVADLMIHDLDIVMNAIGLGVPKKVTAIGKKVHTSSFADYAQATASFKNEVIASVTTSRSTEDKIRTICVHAKGAYIEGDLLNRTLLIKRGTSYLEDVRAASIKYMQSNITEQVVLPNVEPLKEEMLAFGRSVSDDEPPEVGVEQVLQTMRVLDEVEKAIYSQMKEGGAT